MNLGDGCIGENRTKSLVSKIGLYLILKMILEARYLMSL